MPQIDTPDTLQVRTRSYPIALDYVADMKRASVRVLERYLENARDAALLLPQSGAEPVLGHVAPDEPFPNVVYKLPEIDQARGVYFLKAESPEHARRILGDAIRSAAGGSLLARLERLAGGRDGIYQAYYKSRMRHDRRLYIVRAHVLITPVGVRLLSAHRVISGRTVPEHAADGRHRGPVAVPGQLLGRILVRDRARRRGRVCRPRGGSCGAGARLGLRIRLQGELGAYVTGLGAIA